MGKPYKPTFDKSGIPLMLHWSPQDVGNWVKNTLNYPQYEDCFISNFVGGQKLIWIDADNLVKLGVTDFKHIKIITQSIRELLGIEDPQWSRSISLPPRETLSHFLERKSVRGEESKNLTFEKHVRQLKKFMLHDS
ncbi:sterile alpha motif domain-containing protein 15-like [Clytia hemisphaerica]|uniref:sterile alpha motif domain-containing protein 15-like n=1 Tax=Clytia hemisphaerica TaxID=252671 RepID=UPI0034D70631